MGYRNWNAEIIAQMNQTLESSWSYLADEVEVQSLEFQQSVQQMLSLLRQQMRGKGVFLLVLVHLDLTEDHN